MLRGSLSQCVAENGLSRHSFGTLAARSDASSIGSVTLSGVTL
jgi:hypothetical protein